LRWQALVLLLAGLGAGCGGGGTPEECKQPFVPCDADPTGSWALDSICAVMPPGCAGSSSVSAHEISGGLTFSGSGSVSYNWQIEYAFTATIPKSCGYSCQALDDLLGGCSDSGDTCKCAGTSGEGSGGMSDWTTRNGSVDFDLGGSQGTAKFCAQGSVGRLQMPTGLLLLLRRN
jgi:hypothetical protein